ncbi:hypothetical protein RI129_003397 [Pyrocoelia pectoralis]|uniref:Charged multivesicular body protein 4b n=1 Tax=Pyrocoelia pectoralis TaxID=417401 RepID=A0AAN7VGV8_9COLE
MSFFGKLFGGKKEEKQITTGEAIQKLRETEEMLIKKQEFLEKKIEIEMDVAKKNATKNKRVAIQALKKKKRLAKQLEQIDGTLSTIEMQREALEGANTNTSVLDAMKEAADALKLAHKNMDVDQVHDMMDDIAEQQDVAKEISDAISNPVAFGSVVDDEDLEKELEELEQETLENELLKVGPDSLPDIPQAEVSKPRPAKKVEDEDDMKELEAWAS